MPESVKLIECPRDAWQGLKGQVPTELKVAYLRALIGAGFKHIDAVSFVSPKAVPQMADSEQVLEQLDPPDDVEIIGIVVNEQGAQRAVASASVKTLGFPYSVSPTFLQRNQSQTAESAIEELEKIKLLADNNQTDTVVYISMAFGNPYGDLWTVEEVVEAVGILVDMGVGAVSLADTVGLATPEQIATVVSGVVREFEELELGVHLHSRPDSAGQRVAAAYEAGARRFDSALGGLGGCPFAQDLLVGNIPTEIVQRTLAQKGVDLGLNKPLDSVLKMSADIAARHGVETKQ